MAEKTIKKDSWKKKRWFTICAPSIFDKKEIAETVAEKPESVLDRVISISLSEITPQARRSQYLLKVKIVDVQGSKAYTQLAGHETSPSYLKRFVRRRTSKIDAIANYRCKDQSTARITITAITYSKANRKIETLIRKRIIEETTKVAQQKNFDEFVKELLLGNCLMDIEKKLNQLCEVKKIEATKSKLLTKKNQ